MIFDDAFDVEWGDDEARDSKLVFIGKDLDASALATAFNACLATPENLKRKSDALRFAVGDEVQCAMGPSEWADGTVVAMLYRSHKMPPGVVAPYQVKLEPDGDLIYAPSDTAAVIRRRGGTSEHGHGHDHDHARGRGDTPGHFGCGLLAILSAAVAIFAALMYAYVSQNSGTFVLHHNDIQATRT